MLFPNPLYPNGPPVAVKPFKSFTAAGILRSLISSMRPKMLAISLHSGRRCEAKALKPKEPIQARAVFRLFR